MKIGCKYGSHRVIGAKGVLPQTAPRLNNNMEDFWDNEILVGVRTLNIDSASFTQIEGEARGEENKMAEIILRTVKEKGKQQNPVTGSGGNFVGVIEKIGGFLKDKISVQEGDKIVSLVSLSLTPLRIDKIKEVVRKSDQVHVEGKAILFEQSVYIKLPEDMSETLALAVLDVAGAAPQTAKLVKPGDTVLILGAGGKSGMLCAYEARRRLGRSGRVLGTGHSNESRERIKRLNFCDSVIQVDVTQPIEVERMVSELTNGGMADVTINCVNVPDTEMASILSTKQNGIIYFFNMATSFTKATLGAEGVGRDVTMIMGNGYTKDHARHSLEILGESKELRKVFEELYI